MQEYNKQNKKLARMAKRALGKSRNTDAGGDQLQEKFNKDKNKPNELK